MIRWLISYIRGQKTAPFRVRIERGRLTVSLREPQALARRAALFVICYLPVVIFGCGYTTRSMISDKYRTIYIVPFVNKIDITQEADTASKYRLYRPLLETDITKSVANKFLLDGNLKPVKAQSADMVLKGELVKFQKDPLRYTEDSNEVAEYRVNIVVNLSLWDQKDNRLLWKEDNFTGDTTYFTSYATSGTPKSEDTAISNAVTDLSRRIVERTVEQW